MPVFQKFDYLNRTFELASFEEVERKSPRRKLRGRAPGATVFEIDPLTLSAAAISQGASVHLSTCVHGHGIAFVYADMLLFDDELGQVYGPVQRSYVPAAHDREIAGILSPNWEDDVLLELDFTPTLRVLTDGVNSGFGFVSPDRYVGSSSVSKHWLRGIYSTAGQNSREAKMYFNPAGEMEKLMLSGASFGRRTPREIVPQPGDQFAPFVQFFKLPLDESSVGLGSKCLTNTLTFQGSAMRWVEEIAMPGVYLVGIIVQDMDSGRFRKYVKLTVTATADDQTSLDVPPVPK